MSSQLDLYLQGTRIPLSKDNGLRLSKALQEIREPEKRNGSWSRTIRVPGSKEAHKILGHVFEIHHRIQGDPGASTNFAPDFNPNLKADALLLVDGCEALRGYARLLEIQTESSGLIVEYEIQLAGQTKSLFQALEGKRMRDLDFGDLYHTLSRTNISNSWATSYQRNGAPQAFAYGDGYTYPLLDQGGNTLSRKFPVSDMYPALALREILVKMFSAAGYTWTSDSFFNGAFFRRLYHLHHGGTSGLTEAELLAREWRASRSGSNQALAYGTKLLLNNDAGLSNYDPQNAYDMATGTWTVATAGLYTVSLDLEASVQFNVSSQLFCPLFLIYVNGKAQDGLIGSSYNKTTSLQTIYIRATSFPLDLYPGDELEIKFHGFYDPNLSAYPESEVVSFQILQGNSQGFVELQSRSHQAGETYDFATFFSGERTQREFLLDLFRCFNLMVRPSGSNDRELIIKPEDEFYSTQVLDWSAKLDESQEVVLIPMGDCQDQKYLFRYKPAADISNKSYQDRYLEAFGGYEYKINNDFVSSSREIQVGFTLTPSINYGTAWSAVLPHIEYPDGKQQGADRFLYYGGLKSTQAWTLQDSPASGSPSSTYNQYPFFGHVDDPISPSVDLCFGMPREVALALDPGSFYTNNNLFNRYWRSRLELISDPDSKILRGKFRLTPQDWESCTLTELIYVRNEYWRINSIKDWDPLSDGICEVELIRSRTAPAFVPTTKRGRRGTDALDSYGELFPVLKAGDARPGGNVLPSTRGSGSGVEAYGGRNVKILRGDVVSIGNEDCVILADQVQLMNCKNCQILPAAKGSVLIRCQDLEVTVPGIYVDGVLIQTLAGSPPSGTYPVSISGGDFEGANASITFS